MDDNQQGFRENRSTADAAQMFIRIHEEASAVVDETCKKDDDPVATLLDITKAYPRINKPCLWTILRKAGMDERTLRTLEGIHEHTEYRIKGKEGRQRTLGTEERPTRLFNIPDPIQHIPCCCHENGHGRKEKNGPEQKAVNVE